MEKEFYTQVGYIKPYSLHQDVQDKNPLWLAHKIAATIRMANTEANIKQGHVQQVLVAPESSFSYPLNMYPEALRVIVDALEKGQSLLLGSVYQKGERVYQTVFWLHDGLINNFYVKKLLAPFSEKVPLVWRVLMSLVPDSAIPVEFSDQTDGIGENVFQLLPGLRVQPRICFEFYFLPFRNIVEKTSAIFFFVNDSWFDKVFRRILFNLAVLKAWVLHAPMLYVCHYGCSFINPGGNEIGFFDEKAQKEK